MRPYLIWSIFVSLRIVCWKSLKVTKKFYFKFRISCYFLFPLNAIQNCNRSFCKFILLFPEFYQRQLETMLLLILFLKISPLTQLLYQIAFIASIFPQNILLPNWPLLCKNYLFLLVFNSFSLSFQSSRLFETSQLYAQLPQSPSNFCLLAIFKDCILCLNLFLCSPLFPGTECCFSYILLYCNLLPMLWLK